jgi:hypothetical protein
MTDTENAANPEKSGLQNELDAENARLPIDLSQQVMPLEIQIRSMALTLATRHTGDATVKEGNLYQHLKMDNKLAGPLTVDHVISCALIFERFLWGEWSKGLAGRALDQTMDELDEAIKRDDPLGKHLGLDEEPPTRTHTGGEP